MALVIAHAELVSDQTSDPRTAPQRRREAVRLGAFQQQRLEAFELRGVQQRLTAGAAGLAQPGFAVTPVSSQPLADALPRDLQSPRCLGLTTALLDQPDRFETALLQGLEIPPYAFCISHTYKDVRTPKRCHFILRDSIGSLASSLNFAYLNEPLGEDLRPYENKVFLRELLQGNRAMRHLRAAGYRTIVYESQYYEIDLREADRTVGESWAPRPFSVVILQMTPIPALLRRVGIPLFYDLHRARLLSTLAGLPDVTREPSPKFVFAHLMYAHTPLVLDAAGGNVTPQGNYSWTTPVGKGDKQFMEAYRGQLSYLNTKLETVVRRIIAESARPPVIMLQGDHGPEMGLSRGSLSESDVDGRYSIFNAYLFPEGGEEKLYDSISPVNSFRILFNHYFGTSYPLLEDKSYYTTDRLIYDFQPIPEDRFEPR